MRNPVVLGLWSVSSEQAAKQQASLIFHSRQERSIPRTHQVTITAIPYAVLPPGTLWPSVTIRDVDLVPPRVPDSELYQDSLIRLLCLRTSGGVDKNVVDDTDMLLRYLSHLAELTNLSSLLELAPATSKMLNT